MTHLIGATVAQFKETLETMKKVYPFEDDKTKIVSDSNPYDLAHTFLEVTTMDESTGVKVNLSKNIETEEVW